MNHFTAGQCWACRGESWPVNAGFSTKLVKARGRINAGGLGCVVSRHGVARWCKVRQITAIAVGAVRLRRLVAGCTWHGAAG
jgi:hypothetical protein